MHKCARTRPLTTEEMARISHEEHTLRWPDPPVSRQGPAAATARVAQPAPAATATATAVVAGGRKNRPPQRATRLKARAVDAVRGRDFTANDLATALGRGRHQMTSVLNSWVRTGRVERVGTRKEASGQTSTLWRLTTKHTPAGGEE